MPRQPTTADFILENPGASSEYQKVHGVTGQRVKLLVEPAGTAPA